MGDLDKSLIYLSVDQWEGAVAAVRGGMCILIVNPDSFMNILFKTVSFTVQLMDLISVNLICCGSGV